VLNIEAVFGQAVNTELEYHVFLTPSGDCKRLYVSQKTPTSTAILIPDSSHDSMMCSKCGGVFTVKQKAS